MASCTASRWCAGRTSRTGPQESGRGRTRSRRTTGKGEPRRASRTRAGPSGAAPSRRPCPTRCKRHSPAARSPRPPRERAVEVAAHAGPGAHGSAQAYRSASAVTTATHGASAPTTTAHVGRHGFPGGGMAAPSQCGRHGEPGGGSGPTTTTPTQCGRHGFPGGGSGHSSSRHTSTGSAEAGGATVTSASAITAARRAARLRLMVPRTWGARA